MFLAITQRSVSDFDQLQVVCSLLQRGLQDLLVLLLLLQQLLQQPTGGSTSITCIRIEIFVHSFICSILMCFWGSAPAGFLFQPPQLCAQLMMRALMLLRVGALQHAGGVAVVGRRP